MLEIVYLFLIPSKNDGRVPKLQQGAPTTCNLTYWEVFQQTYVQTGHRAKFGHSVGEGREGFDRIMGVA